VNALITEEACADPLYPVASRKRARAPVTCGVAMLVPLIVA
jgi:hypothetical protein